MKIQLQFYAARVHPRNKPKDTNLWLPLKDDNWSAIDAFEREIVLKWPIYQEGSNNNIAHAHDNNILFRNNDFHVKEDNLIAGRIWYGKKGSREDLLDGNNGQHVGIKAHKDFGVVPLFYQLRHVAGKKNILLGVQRTGHLSAAYQVKTLLQECLQKKFPQESEWVVKVDPIHINWSTKQGFFQTAKAKKIDIIEFKKPDREGDNPVSYIKSEITLTPYSGSAFPDFIGKVLGGDLSNLPDDDTTKAKVISLYCPEIDIDAANIQSINVTFEDSETTRKIDFANFKSSGTLFDITDEAGTEPNTLYPNRDNLQRICKEYSADLFSRLL